MSNFLSFMRNREPSDHDVVLYAISGDRALNDQYKYGLSNPVDTPEKFANGGHQHNFGWHANMGSAREALKIMGHGERNVEKISTAIHNGWGNVAKNFDDPVYGTKPEKRTARLGLANTPYHKLSEDEKEKDRVLAKTYLAKFDPPQF